VRHVRMRILGIGLLVALFASAFGASSALAKDPYTQNTFQQYKHCPFNAPEITDCFTGITLGGATGGYFQYGSVLAKLSKSITIQGGYKGAGSSIEVIAPEDGAKLLESPPEPIVKGLNVITAKIQTQAEWPEALKASFAEAKANKETQATATIEMAGNECTTVPGCIYTESILFEEPEPPAFRLPLKVKVGNAWLEKLGGTCLIGSDENPIKQDLVSSGAGTSGELKFEEPTFESLELAGSRLVDVGWHISKAQGANGCGGPENEAYIDRALNIALEVESPEGNERVGKKGVTVLSGNLHDSAASHAKKKIEEGSK
jgi:hypothetical protein